MRQGIGWVAGLAAWAVGIAQAEMQIVGGKSISIDEAPWQLMLGANGAGCGASWISGKWALTAAHCVDNVSPTNPSNTYVWAGATTMSRDRTNANRIQVIRIRSHPDYGRSGAPNSDIAVLELAAPITQTRARPILLSTRPHTKW